MDIFTERFNEVIKSEKVVQSDLANKVGIARQCITDYKSGKSYPTIQTLRILCRELEVSSDYFLGLSDDDFGARTTAPSDNGLNSDERELLSLFRTLSPYLKGMTLNAVRSWANDDEDSTRKKV